MDANQQPEDASEPMISEKAIEGEFPMEKRKKNKVPKRLGERLIRRRWIVLPKGF